MFDLHDFQERYGDWANKTFGDDPQKMRRGILAHIAEEVQEFLEEPSGEEAADIGMLLLHWCHLNGVSLSLELERKFQINQNRE